MKKDLLIKALFCLLLFASCKNGFSNEDKEYSFENVADDELVTPYTDMKLLENTRSATVSDPDVVDWKVARFFAVVEKIEFEDNYKSWKGAKISEKPIIIYYANSDKPRYYEFRVIKDDIEVGSITCNASKKEGKPVVYVSEMANKVLGKVAKELATRSSNARLSVVNYPNQFVVESNNTSARGVEGLQREFKNARTNEFLDANKVFIEERVDVMLEKANAKTLEELQITEDERLELLKEIRETHELDSEMWEDIDGVKDEIIAMSDEEIESKMNSDSARTKRLESSETNTIYWNFLYDWYDKREWLLYNRGAWCGPYAVTFITMGLGEKSGYSDVPASKNEWRKLIAMYDVFENTIGTGPKFISTLDSGMQKHTNYRIERVRSHRWRDVNNHLLNHKLPVLSLRSGWYGNYAGYHYRTIVGVATCHTTENHFRWRYWFGWYKKRWTKEYYTDWYYMHDAGVDTYGWYNYHVDGDKQFGNFWERSGLLCQRRLGLVKHK